jgi:hypothetical protein
VETCSRCDKALQVIASIEEPALIERILAHGRRKGEYSEASLGPDRRSRRSVHKRRARKARES